MRNIYEIVMLTLGSGCMLASAASAADRGSVPGIFGATITVSAPRHTYRNVIVSVPLTTEQALYSEPRMRLRSLANGHSGKSEAQGSEKNSEKSSEDGSIDAQVTRLDGKFSLTFVIADLEQGTSRAYRFLQPPPGRKK